MKLLMISGDRSVLQGKRGAFWYTLEGLSKHWERIDVIVPKVASFEFRVAGSRNPQPATRNPFPNVFFHPSPRGIWYQPWWILVKGDELIKEHHHDMMTVHEYPPFYNGIGAKWLHRSAKIPYCLEIHHIVGYPVASSLTESIGKVLSRAYLARDTRAAKAVRTVNGEVKRVLGKWGVTLEKIHVVPSFYLDAELLKPDPSIRKDFDLVFCGRLVANKGLDDVLRAVAGLPGIRLYVIGDGPLRGASERLARSLGIQDQVTFAWWLNSKEEMVRQVQRARIFVMHSRSEGGPRVALEAMALGLPVIVTRVGVMPDVIQDGINGIFTDGTIEGLQMKIQDLHHDFSWQEHIGREARKILEKLERKKLVKEYAEFLKTLTR